MAWALAAVSELFKTALHALELLEVAYSLEFLRSAKFQLLFMITSNWSHDDRLFNNLECGYFNEDQVQFNMSSLDNMIQIPCHIWFQNFCVRMVKIKIEAC